MARATEGPQSRNLGSLINGVSRQPPEVRLTSQAQTQDNCLSRLETGVTRRPPSEHIARIETSAVPTAGYHIHTIDRDENERYAVILEDDDIRVFDLLTGTEAVVSTPDGKGYLGITGDRAGNAFSVVSVADLSVIVNREKVTAMSGSTSASRPNEFLLNITNTPSTVIQWTVEIGGVVNTLSKIQQDTEAHIDDLLSSELTVGNYPNWTFTKIASNVIYGEQTSNTGTPESVQISSSWGDTGWAYAYKTIQKFTDLPIKGKDGFVVEVIGTDGDDTNNFFVEYDDETSTWNESVAGGLDNSFDASTMPHKLTRTALDPLAFTFEQITWPSRAKGDIESAPEPSFVGNAVKDAVFHKNRFALLSDENVSLSESGGLFNFWPTSVIVLIESDPIDVSSSNNQVALLDYAVPFSGNLTLFSGSGSVQNELVGSQDEPLKITNARVEERGFYEASGVVRPVAMGMAVYFPVDRSTTSGILEYTAEQGGAFAAEEISSHIPNYLPANIHSLVASSTENALVAASEDEGNALYVYMTYHSNNDKLMSSWSRWVFEENDVVLSLSFMRTKLYMVVDRADGTHIEAMDFRKANDGGLAHSVYLDSQVELTGVYSAATDVTTWTLPYSQTGITVLVLSGSGWSNDQRGQAPPGGDYSVPGQVTLDGDYSASTVHIGRVQDSFYGFSEPTLTSQRDRQALPETQGRLQISKWKVLYNDTCAFTAEVTYEDDDTTYEYPYSNAYIGNAVFGPPAPEDGEFEFDAQGRSTHLSVGIRSSSYLPFTLTTADWAGYWVSHRG